MDVCWSEKLNMQVICPPRNTDKENHLNDFLVQRNLNIGIQPKQYIQLAILAVEEYWACWKTITDTLIFCRSSPIFLFMYSCYLNFYFCNIVTLTFFKQSKTWRQIQFQLLIYCFLGKLLDVFNELSYTLQAIKFCWLFKVKTDI